MTDSEVRNLSISEAARRAGVGMTTMRSLIRQGKVRTVTIGSRVRSDGSTIAGRRLVPIEEVDAYLDTLVLHSDLTVTPKREANAKATARASRSSNRRRTNSA